MSDGTYCERCDSQMSYRCSLCNSDDRFVELSTLEAQCAEWKRRALAAEEMLADLQGPQILHITCSECDEELSVGITVTPRDSFESAKLTTGEFNEP